MVLKKEIVKSQNKDFEKGSEYRQLLVAAIHGAALKFPDVAANVVHLLMDFLGECCKTRLVLQQPSSMGICSGLQAILPPGQAASAATPVSISHTWSARDIMPPCLFLFSLCVSTPLNPQTAHRF